MVHDLACLFESFVHQLRMNVLLHLLHLDFHGVRDALMLFGMILLSVVVLRQQRGLHVLGLVERYSLMTLTNGLDRSVQARCKCR